MQITATRGLLAMNGLKTPTQWTAMDFEAKAAWLASLSPLGRRGQAGVNATASGRDVEAIILAWVIMGLLTDDQALEALAATPDATLGGEASR
jgi:hypothetical protein